MTQPSAWRATSSYGASTGPMREALDLALALVEEAGPARVEELSRRLGDTPLAPVLCQPDGIRRQLLCQAAFAAVRDGKNLSAPVVISVFDALDRHCLLDVAVPGPAFLWLAARLRGAGMVVDAWISTRFDLSLRRMGEVVYFTLAHLDPRLRQEWADRYSLWALAEEFDSFGHAHADPAEAAVKREEIRARIFDE